MARRKLPAAQKKIMISLTLRPDAKQMLFAISDATGKSISALVEEYAQKEYTKLRKAKKCADIDVPGQMELSDINTGINTYINTDYSEGDSVTVLCCDEVWQGVVKKDSSGKIYIEHSDGLAYYPTSADKIIKH